MGVPLTDGQCNWDVEEMLPAINASKMHTASSSSTSSVKSGKDSRSTSATRTPVDASTLSTPIQKSDKPVRVSYLTEQTSHHPPVSAFYVDCPEKGLTARGFDQLSAKFTGTSIKVTPGEHNLGIFIDLQKRDNEQYQLTHPAAHLGGLLRGSLSVTVGDQCYVTCPKTKIKTILHYLEEGWLGKTQNKVEGVVFLYDPENDDKTRIRDVPEKDILVRIQGNWKDKVYYSLAPKFDKQILIIDLEPLAVTAKLLPPTEMQLPNESLKFWSGVTEAIKSRQFWQPRFFTGAVTPLGKPELTEDGREALKKLQAGEWDIKESRVLSS